MFLLGCSLPTMHFSMAQSSVALMRQVLAQSSRCISEGSAASNRAQAWAWVKQVACLHSSAPSCTCSSCGRVCALPQLSEASALPSSQHVSHVTSFQPAAQNRMSWGSVRHFASGSAEKGNSNGAEAAPSEDEATPSKEGEQPEKGEAEQPEEAPQQLSIEQLTSERALLAAQVDKLTDQLKRSLAEMENVRMRTARDVDSAKKFAVQGFVKNVLDVADNLERAFEAVPPSALAEEGEALDADQLRKLLKGLVEGVSATQRILLNVLKQAGVEQYNPLGEKFDPNMHNALFQMPDASKEPGTVASVTKRGYKLHERVIRPADVGVVAAP